MPKTYTVLGWKRIFNADRKAGMSIVVHAHGRYIADVTSVMPTSPTVRAYGVIQAGSGPDFHTQASMKNAMRALRELKIDFVKE